MNKSRRIILGLGITATIVSGALFSFARTSLAATGLTIQPIKISQTLKPGDQSEGDILLTNASAKDVQVDISIQDFVPTAGTATFQFIGRAPGVTTVMDWVSINSPHTFLFKQGASEKIHYSIKTPKDAEPGSHFGVVFFKATNLSDINTSIQVGTQVGVLVFVTIPGKFEQKGKITDLTAPAFVQHGPVNFSMSFENTGTVYFEPKGTIEIKSMFGTKIGAVPIEGYAVLPTGLKKMNFPWNVSGLLVGKYTATASIYDVDGNMISSVTTSFWAFPVWYLVGFVIVLLVLYFVFRFLRKKVNFNISLK